MTEGSVSVTLRQEQDYRFLVESGGGIPSFFADEPAPLGGGSGPAPTHLLGAAVGNCLSGSLLFALRKFKQRPEPIRTEVTVTIGRNEYNRLRVTGIHVRMTIGVPALTVAHLERALAQFEDFCTVTQSIAAAIPVSVEVFDSDGVRLHASGPGPALAVARSVAQPGIA